jgi:hypothetical protein
MLRDSHSVRYYPWGSGAFYEVKLSRDASIAFYGNEMLLRKSPLSLYEQSIVIDRLAKLTLPFALMSEETLICDPENTSRLQIRSKNLNLKIVWTTSALEMDMKTYTSVVNLVDLFCDLLPLQGLNFEPPELI